MAKQTWSDLEKPKKKKRGDFKSQIIPEGKTILRLHPPLALEIGLNESLVLLQFEWWLHITPESEGHVREGRKWIWKSHADLRTTFPFWSMGTVHNILQSLLKQGLLLAAGTNYNRHKYDRTKWYTIDWDAITRLKSYAP